MIRSLTSLCLALMLAGKAWAASPDEGMWLPLYIKKYNEKDAQKAGMKLSAEDIYNINKSSVKDAIVRMGSGFCTAELVSPDGLLFTNHHCGYDAIADASTKEDDILKNGFWAASHDKEKPVPGLTISRLVYMTDVTNLYTPSDNITNPDARMKRRTALRDSLVKDAIKGNEKTYTAEVKSFFAGNEQYLLVYETFRDVRLVGAPEGTIGKFGGDVDNWMWPRHTGDFSILRVYAGADNKPADYSPSNVPYKPMHYLPISLKGVKEGDFAMIMGYPGSTERYLTSYEVEFDRDYANPSLADALATRLDVMKTDMDADRGFALKVASDYASLANYQKNTVGLQRMLGQKDLVSMKRAEEAKVQQWIDADPARKEKYGKVLSNIKSYKEQQRPIQSAANYVTLGLFVGPISSNTRFYTLYKAVNDEKGGKISRKELDSMIQAQRLGTNEYLKSESFKTDRKIVEAELIQMHRKLAPENRPAFLNTITAKYKDMPAEQAISKYVDEMYKTSILLDSNKLKAWAKKPDTKKIAKDPMVNLMGGLLDYYFGTVQPVNAGIGRDLAMNQKLWQKALMEYNSGKTFYPDANATLRFTYGNVKPYKPRDGVMYNWYTTADGILQKNDPKDPEFAAPTKEVEMLQKRQYGPYGRNGELVVNFLTTDDITGGNSGSPVMDAEGNLIGLAFDGNWEGMLNDMYIDPNLNRTICVDIGYVLWVIDEYAGAKHLVKELTIKR